MFAACCNLRSQGTVTDVNGNVYSIVTIGTQTWMQQNLRSTSYNDGTPIPFIANSSDGWSGIFTPACDWYNNDTAGKVLNGVLYNGYAVWTGNLAPVGWHVATNAEWATLLNYLGGASAAGTLLIKTGSTGFAAIMAGSEEGNGSFNSELAVWWTSTGVGGSGSNLDVWQLNQGNSTVDNFNSACGHGFSVRCIKDTGSTAKSQSITFNVITAQTYGTSYIILTATSSSGLKVTYSSSDLSVATILGDTVKILTAGTTTITANQTGDSVYSAASPVTHILTVNKKALTITGAVAANKVYDGTTHASISGAILSAPIGSDVVDLTTDTSGTFASAGVGTGISVSTAMTLTGAAAGNYSVTQQTTLTANITAKPLTATANNLTRVYGVQNPALTISYSGFVSGQTSADITAPAISTSATINSNVGSYNIILSGGSAANYSITLVNGTFTITIANQTITFDSIPPVTVGEPAFDLTATASSGLPVSYTSSDTSVVKINGDMATILSNGLATITAIQAGNEDYNASPEITEILKVNKFTQIENTIVTAGLNLYPNPASGVVKIITENYGLLTLTYVSGKIVKQVNITENLKQLDVSGLSAGYYIVRIQSENAIVTGNLVVE